MLHPQAHLARAEKVAMSAIGPKRTFVFASHMSAFGGKADVVFWFANVR
jgi:hypothetical protein